MNYTKLTKQMQIRLFEKYRKNFTHQDLKEIVEVMLDIIKEQVKQRNTVVIKEFGTFGWKFMNTRMVRRPDTQELVPTLGKVYFKFTPSKKLHEHVRGENK